LIQNWVSPAAYLPPSADGACGRTMGVVLPPKVSRTDPDDPGVLNAALNAVPSLQRYLTSAAVAGIVEEAKATQMSVRFMRPLS